MKFLQVLAGGVLGLMSMQAGAQAPDSPWLLRARVVQLDTANKSSPLGGAGAADRLHVADKTIPEVDISYFFTPNLAAELVLTYPQKHEVTLDGAAIGSFKHLPPSLLAQYHFDAIGAFSPYLGAGLNYTRISQVKLLGGAARLEHHSTGLALQAGVDFNLGRNWSLNLDVKRLALRSDVIIAGKVASTVKIDPLLVGFGVGYRF